MEVLVVIAETLKRKGAGAGRSLMIKFQVWIYWLLLIDLCSIDDDPLCTAYLQASDQGKVGGNLRIMFLGAAFTMHACSINNIPLTVCMGCCGNVEDNEMMPWHKRS